MSQKFSELDLSKKISVNKLLSKVGSVYFKGNKSGGKVGSIIRSGSNLKSAIVKIAKGKSPYTVNWELKNKYGIAGAQEEKRKAIMEMV